MAEKSVLADKPFFYGLLREDNGSPSLARFATVLAITSSIGWVTYLAIRNGGLPDLMGVTAFCSAFYGSNKIMTKISEAIAGYRAKSAASGQPPTPPQEQ